MTEEEKYKQSIGYKPDITYIDDYHSDATDIFNNGDDSNEVPSIDDETIGDLIDMIPILDSLINKLPNDLSNGVGEVNDPIFDFIEDELKDKEYEDIPEEDDWIYEPVEPVIPPGDEDIYPGKPGDEEGEVTEDDIWDDDDFFPIQKEEHPKEEIVEKEYIKNLSDLLEDYFTNLHTILSEFWFSLIPAIADKPLNEIELITNNIILNNSDIIPEASHLLDAAVRAQIIKTLKFNYFTNLFNAEKTMIHLKQFKATYLLRLRYAKTEALNGDTKTNQMNNNILKAMETTYDKRYDTAYENLYRYLSSSNKVLADILQTIAVEVKSKQTLIERKGIK